MSGLRKRSLAIAGHRTSVSLEEPFWEALKEIAATEKRPIASLVMEVDSGRGEPTSPRRCGCACWRITGADPRP